VRFFHFENLIENPDKNIHDMQNFVGRGDYSKALSTIEPKLSRSNRVEVESDLLTDAEFVYEKFCAGAKIINESNDREKAKTFFEELIEYLDDPKRLFNRQRRRWPCFRMNHMVAEKECYGCLTDPVVRYNAIKDRDVAPIKNDTHWSEEPCLFECGMDLDREEDEYLTIEESIRNNFWKSDKFIKPKNDVKVSEMRLMICKTSMCGNYVPNDGKPKCTECDCYLEHKSRFATETCPEDLWP
jgi:hypothetical protein